MRSPARFLESSDPLRPAEPPAALPFDSDVVVILAALLCALICVVGLALVARCACLRRAAASPSSSSSSSSSPFPAPPSKGLKKKAVRALPTISFGSSAAAGAGDGAADPEAASGVKLVDCAICLAEFAEGEVVRVLPQCGHGFHAECVDTWLRSHSSCPSCRRVLVIPATPRCRECGASSGGGSSDAKEAVGRGSSAFLP